MKRICAFILVLTLAFSLSLNAFAMKYGDVTGDGKINSSDALLTLMHSTGVQTIPKSTRAAADVTGDGKINSSDALLILNRAVGLIKIFPAEESGDPDIGHDVFG